MTIFVQAPSFAELERRLRERATESAGEIGERLELARRQAEEAGDFDFVVTNDDVERAVSELEGIVDRALSEASAARGKLLAMMYPRIDDLLESAGGSRYGLVIAAAKRARQINNYHHQLGEGTFDDFAPPLVESRSKNYLTMALEEIAEGKITISYT